jgi:hypothetical protein
MAGNGGGGAGGGFRLTQDTVAGVLVIALSLGILAVLATIGSTKYQQIAPDLFPRVCAYALLAGGGLLLARGLIRGGEGFEVPRLRSLALVVVAVVAFGLVAPSYGYAPAGLATMIISGLAAPDLRLRSLALVTLAVIAFSFALFTLLLKLPIPFLSLPGFKL